MSGGLNGRRNPAFWLRIEVRSNGDPASASSANITLRVLTVPHAPVVNDTAGPRYVPENSPLGALISPNISSFNVDDNINVFSVVVTATYTGRVNVTSSGALYVSGALDYETMAPVWCCTHWLPSQ